MTSLEQHRLGTNRAQDGGAPVTDSDPQVQIERLLWDDNSDRVVRENHRTWSELATATMDAEEMVVLGRWWDSLDDRVHPLGPIFAPLGLKRQP